MRIGVSGPANVGKTTFVNDFLVEFPNFTLPRENYRETAKGKRINQLTTKTSQLAILRTMLRAEKEKGDVIFDRIILDNYVYTKAQFLRGKINKRFLLMTEMKMWESVDNLDMLFFIPTALSVELKEDSLRDTDKGFLDLTNRLFIENILVASQRISVKVLTGTRAERIELARRYLNS